MSARYVWSKHNVSLKTSSSSVNRFIFSAPTGSNDAGKLAGYCGWSVSYVDGSGWDIKGDSSGAAPKPVYVSTPQEIAYNTCAFAPKSTGNFEAIMMGSTSNITNVKWLVGSYTTGKLIIEAVQADFNGVIQADSERKNFTLYKVTGYDTTSSTKIGTVSSSSQSTYPTTSEGGLQNGYVYLYLGSDNIDAISTSSSSSSSLKPGSSCNIIVSSRANSYGGTISYLYQYSVNGGSWTNISTTSNTSITFIIPNNATSIMFRTRAQDNMGFTSSDYVSSPLYTVTTSSGGGTVDPSGPLEPDRKERKTLWVGVDDVARKVANLMVGVDGKARKVIKGYVGVDGSARIFYGGMSSGLLPSGYTELEYILATARPGSSTSISTSINSAYNSRLIFDIDIDIRPNERNNYAYFAYTYSGSGIWLKVLTEVPYNKTYYFYTQVSDNGQKKSSIQCTLHRSIIDFDLPSLTLGITDITLDQYDSNKYLKTTIDSPTFTDGAELKLFHMHDNGSIPANRCAIKVYDFKHYKGDTLVQRLIPCRSPNNAIGFFDVVGGNFLSVTQSGGYYAGPDA